MGKGWAPTSEIDFVEAGLSQSLHDRERFLAGQVPIRQVFLSDILKGGQAERALHIAGLPQVEID